MPYQMPGIYRLRWLDNNSKKIQLGTGSYLIGDGVTLVFDSNWPDQDLIGHRLEFGVSIRAEYHARAWCSAVYPERDRGVDG